MILIFHLIVWKNITWIRIFLEFKIISFSELPLSVQSTIYPDCCYQIKASISMSLRTRSFSHCFGILYFMLCKDILYFHLLRLLNYTLQQLHFVVRE